MKAEHGRSASMDNLIDESGGSKAERKARHMLIHMTGKTSKKRKQSEPNMALRQSFDGNSVNHSESWGLSSRGPNERTLKDQHKFTQDLTNKLQIVEVRQKQNLSDMKGTANSGFDVPRKLTSDLKLSKNKSQSIQRDKSTERTTKQFKPVFVEVDEHAPPIPEELLKISTDQRRKIEY